VVVLRDGREHTLFIMPQMLAARGPAPYEEFGPRHQAFYPPQGQFGQYGQPGFAPEGQRPALGVTLRPAQNGLLISSVHRGSPAFEARLFPGDVIGSVNGQQVCSVPQLLTTLSMIRPGQPVQLGVSRGQQFFTVNTTVANWDEAFAGEPVQMTQEQWQDGGQFAGQWQQHPQFQGQQPGQMAQGQFGAPRTALRPGLDVNTQVEQMEQHINSLEQELEMLRRQLDDLRQQRGAGDATERRPGAPGEGVPPAPEAAPPATRPEAGERSAPPADAVPPAPAAPGTVPENNNDV
jgi:hypothetical protein